MMQRECSVMKRKNVLVTNPNNKEIFSSFSDCKKYNGLMQSADYLTNVYEKYHCTIKTV